MYCCAHILNLIVKEGLDVIVGSVEKFRNSVVFWWNSTYLMLNSALIYKDVFARLKQREPQYNCFPSEKDWEVAKEICDRLKLFFEVTELFLGTKYPTANLYFPKICEIRFSIYEWKNSTCDEIRIMASSMISKFEQYWDVILGIMAIATILDPRQKMKLIEYYFSIIYGDGAYTKIEKNQKICDELVGQYRLTSKLSEEVHHFPTNSSSSQAREVRLGKVNHMANFDASVSNATSIASIKSDFDYYLEEPLMPRDEDFDILNWWKANASKYPILHAIARDVLAIPVSTVASESAFSTSGRFVSPHRSRHHPKTLQALMCTQDWLWTKFNGMN
ncbi:hypothetical protein Dsin_001647 [Dipteronia sinensis]|uniref:Uncharacterized protein n=1 Tax=Dipteronia sinensis TaxID=43782 RepID=A0AAE0B4B3_9ROSI|nr:hypothetical protein Dsin_001647 [Dipteronia sinensis]